MTDEPLAGLVAIDALVDDIVTIARIPSPTFAEARRLDWIDERLRGAPGERRRDAAGNLIWSWGQGRPALLVTAHVDTVFPAETELAFVRGGGRLTGPGVGDNAAAVAVAIHVALALLAPEELAPGAVAFTVGEEGLGNLRGARRACAELGPAAMIALEGHGLGTVVADAVGSIRARVTVSGPGGHAWIDRGQPSAIHGLIALAAHLLDADEPDSPVNIGLIEGGIAVNAIAGRAQFVVEKRSAEPAALAAFTGRLHGLDVAAPLELAIEILGERPAGVLPRDSPLLEAVLDVRRRLGLPQVLEAGSTDANAALGRGIPALSLGVANGRGMHTVGESIDVESLESGARQLALVMAALLGGGG